MKNILLKDKKKVLVGMSGGVDSAVSAALLVERGFDVTGVYLKTWKELSQNNSDDEKAARVVAEKLGIEFRTLDVEERFRKLVVEYFLAEYAIGRTPNPCVFCNKEFKFKLLLTEARKIEADYVVTGHYARLQREIRNSKFEIRNKFEKENLKLKTSSKYVYKLFQAKDKEKDQSYFLWRLKQKELSKILFPLGEYTKTEVREMAKKWNLPVAKKKESQDLCFVSNERFQSFLRESIIMRKGSIEDAKGNKLGEHLGLPAYTMGQRKGINLGGDGPYYVYSKNMRRNILKVAKKDSLEKLSKKQIKLEQVSWISKIPRFPFRALVKTRYRQEGEYGIIKSRNTKHETRNTQHEIRNDIYEINFEEAQRAVAPGQSAVFYSEEGEVLGGGIIVV